MRQLLLILVTGFLFSGCWLCKPDIQYKDRLVILEPPKSLLEKKETPAPPAKDEYMKSDVSEREYLLTLYILDLLETNGILNTKIDGLGTWVGEQKIIYERINQDAEKHRK